MDPDFRGHRAILECTINQQRSRIRVRCGDGIEMPGELSDRTITFATPPMTKDRLVASYMARLNEEGTEFRGGWTLTGGVLNAHGRFTATKR
jgi:hypothetical protein